MQTHISSYQANKFIRDILSKDFPKAIILQELDYDKFDHFQEKLMIHLRENIRLMVQVPFHPIYNADYRKKFIESLKSIYQKNKIKFDKIEQEIYQMLNQHHQNFFNDMLFPIIYENGKLIIQFKNFDMKDRFDSLHFQFSYDRFIKFLQQIYDNYEDEEYNQRHKNKKQNSLEKITIQQRKKNKDFLKNILQLDRKKKLSYENQRSMRSYIYQSTSESEKNVSESVQSYEEEDLKNGQFLRQQPSYNQKQKKQKEKKQSENINKSSSIRDEKTIKKEMKKGLQFAEESSIQNRQTSSQRRQRKQKDRKKEKEKDMKKKQQKVQNQDQNITNLFKGHFQGNNEISYQTNIIHNLPLNKAPEYFSQFMKNMPKTKTDPKYLNNTGKISTKNDVHYNFPQGDIEG